MGIGNRLVLVASTLVCLAAVCAHAVEPVRIGVSIGLTGRYAPMGNMYAKGLQLWEKEMNSKGGLLGRPLILAVYDDRSSTSEARRIYLEMLSQKRVDFVFGPYSSANSKAVADIAEQYRYPTLFPMASSNAVWAVGRNYAFGIMTLERHSVGTVFTFLARHGIQKVGMLVDESLFRMGAPNEGFKWARRLDLQIVLHEAWNPASLLEQLRRARELEVEALLVWGYMEQAISTRQALEEIGWRPRLFFSQASPAVPEYRRILGPSADYTVGTSIWEPDASKHYPGSKEFAEAFFRQYGIQPTYHAAIGFAAGEILAQAITRAGCLDRERVRDSLSTLDTVTLIGRYGVDSRGMQVRQRQLIIQWQNGEKKVLWPEPMSNGKLLFPGETNR